jgi:hypothetical protein
MELAILLRAIHVVLVVLAVMAAIYVDQTATALARLFAVTQADTSLPWVAASLRWHSMTWLWVLALVGLAVHALIVRYDEQQRSIYRLLLAFGIFLGLAVWSHAVVWAMYSNIYAWGAVV